ncbi:putative AAA family ATPase [Xylophilus phage Lumi]|nr:putative AAA family ATPase [Xylophilus phage Lumi]
MLQKLRIQNAWVHKDRTFEFAPGHTLITGRNGKGKTLIPELIQYALWGSKALRGAADDYKKVIVDLWFHMKGRDYHITRSGSKCVLETGGEAIAKGVKFVNAAIANLFGYDYQVFQVSNAANQGSIELLGTMKPMERKRMVDQTIGLNILDVLETTISDELKALRPKLQAKQEALKPLVKPVEPEGYGDVGALEVAATAMRKRMETLAVLKKQAETPIPTVTPWCPTGHEQDLDGLVEAEERFKVDMTQRKDSEKQLSKLPPEAVRAELHARDSEYSALRAVMTNNASIRRDKAHLEKAIGQTPRTLDYDQAKLDYYNEQAALRKRFAEYQTLLDSQHELVCPNCDHHWHEEDPRLKAYADLPEGYSKEEIPNNAGLKKMQADLNAVLAAKPLFDALDGLEAEAPEEQAVILQIEAARVEHGKWEAAEPVRELRAQLRARLAQPALESKATLIAEIQASIRAGEEHTRQSVRAKEVLEQVETVKLAIQQFPEDLEHQYRNLSAKIVMSSNYDAEVKRYDKDHEDWCLLNQEIVSLEADSDSLVGARTAIFDTRTDVKGYLLPSLNSVASRLVSEMTAGELSDIVVDEEFEVRVMVHDESGSSVKNLDTLSGAGKAVANLALRLALGQVLTNSVFPVVMLDEIDASCDDVRAQYISDCVARLAKSMGQVIVISHKPEIQAENRIEL